MIEQANKSYYMRSYSPDEGPILVFIKVPDFILRPTERIIDILDIIGECYEVSCYLCFTDIEQDCSSGELYPACVGLASEELFLITSFDGGSEIVSGLVTQSGEYSLVSFDKYDEVLTLVCLNDYLIERLGLEYREEETSIHLLTEDDDCEDRVYYIGHQKPKS
ncbi:hypothetical protein IJ114_00110 [Candidatus Saccharibacteria bacterium]|nr:hypothetical protein [Candidatus Saccharibacteria bacterium]